MQVRPPPRVSGTLKTGNRVSGACCTVTGMPLPVSKSSMDKLGARLRDAERPADEDLALFRQIAGHCQAVLSRVQSQLEGLGYEGPTPRVKTTGTLVDKLRREHMRLSQVQDIAGARVIVADRAEQDGAVSAICQLFESQGCACKISDRLENSSHGYRAIHVIVTIDQVNVEIQVRTDLQDTWAQIVEELADTWGRGIRYGEEPLKPDAMIQTRDFLITRGDALDLLKRFSEAIAVLENGRQRLRHLQDFLTEVAWPTVESLSGEVRGDLVLDPATAGSIEVFASGALHFGLMPPLPDGWRQARGREAVKVLRRSVEWIEHSVAGQVEATGSAERALRDTLQMIASATEAEG